MVSVCLPSDALLQLLPSYLGFSYLGRGYLFTGAPAKRSRCSLPWTRGYLLTAALPDLQLGIASLGPLVPVQPLLLGCGVGLPGRRPWPQTWVALLHRSCTIAAWHSRLLPLTSDVGFGLLNLIWEPILCEACSFNMGQQTGPTYGRLKQRPVRDYLKIDLPIEEVPISITCLGPPITFTFPIWIDISSKFESYSSKDDCPLKSVFPLFQSLECFGRSQELQRSASLLAKWTHMISSLLCNLSGTDAWCIWANVVKKQVYIIFFWLHVR